MRVPEAFFNACATREEDGEIFFKVMRCRHAGERIVQDAPDWLTRWQIECLTGRGCLFVALSEGTDTPDVPLPASTSPNPVHIPV